MPPNKLQYKLLYFYFFILLSCGHAGNPVDSGKKYSVDGCVSYYYYNSFVGMYHVSVHLSGNGVNLETTSDAWGYYHFPDLDSGQYTITVSEGGYSPYPDSLRVKVTSDIRADDFFLLDNGSKPSTAFVMGAVSLVTGDPIPGVKILLSRTGKTAKTDSIFTDAHGHFFYLLSPGERATLSPKRDSFSFIPQNVDIVADRFIVPCFITASAKDVHLHSISGRVIDCDGNPVNGSVRVEDETISIDARTDSSGKFFIPGLRDGTYALLISNSGFIVQPPQLSTTVTVKGGDLVLPDMIEPYTGPTTYTLTGNVINQNGKGISDATIKVAAKNWVSDYFSGDVTTRSDGTFSGKALVGTIQSVFIFKLSKAGCVIQPDSAMVTISRIEGKKDGGSISIPSFTGFDYTIYSPSDYVPLRSGAIWTFDRTLNSATPVKFTTSIIGAVTVNGFSYCQYNFPGPAGLTLFRIEGNSVRSVIANTNAELLRFGVVPGTSWEVGEMSGQYPVTGTFLGLETVTVPAGTFPESLKFEVRTTYGATSYEAYTLWFAKGTGLVKSEKILVNYGAVKETIVDTLR